MHNTRPSIIADWPPNVTTKMTEIKTYHHLKSVILSTVSMATRLFRRPTRKEALTKFIAAMRSAHLGPATPRCVLCRALVVRSFGLQERTLCGPRWVLEVGATLYRETASGERRRAPARRSCLGARRGAKRCYGHAPDKASVTKLFPLLKVALHS
jgi:hypothetical protein